MALKTQPTAPYNPSRSWGLTISRAEAKAGGWGPGGGLLPTKHHTLPCPLKRQGDLGSHAAL